MTRPARPQPKSKGSPSLAASAASAIAHPVFPLVSAMWFAALFGMGAVAAGGEALASLVGHLHLTTILPSAAPPLGTTAHILIAIGLTVLGGGFGLVLGLVLYARASGAVLFDPSRIAKGLASARAGKPAPATHETVQSPPAEASSTPAPRVRNRDAHPDAPPRRPLVVTEDVLPYHGSQAPISAAPEAEAADIAPEPAAPAEPVTNPPAWTTEIIETGVAHDHDETPLGAFMTGLPSAQFAEQPAEVPPFFATHSGEAPPLAQSGIYNAGEAIVLPPETGLPTDLAHVVSVPAHPAEPVFQAPSQSSPASLASQAAAAPHEPIVETPVASLGLVQLIERLALAITVRQAQQDARQHQAPGHRPVGEHVADPGEPLLRAKPPRLGQVSDAVVDHQPTPFAPEFVQHSAPRDAAPLPLRDPFARIDADHPAWDDAADDILPPRFLRSPLDPQPVIPDHAPLAQDTVAGVIKTHVEPAGAQYSSLVNMAMVRPDLPTRLPEGPGTDAVFAHAPVVPFPAPAGDTAASAPQRAPTDEADRALRDALATLRRMSAQR